MIIGLSGISKCGKDTLAQKAIELFGGERVSLGDITRTEVAEFYTENRIDFKVEDLWGNQEERMRQIAMPFPLAQKIGFDIGKKEKHMFVFNGRNFTSWWCNDKRKNDTDYFIKKALLNIYSDLCYVTDMRFSNEAEYIRSNGGKLVRINRMTVISEDNIDHQLDWWEDWDLVINNNKSLEHFYEVIKNDFKSILKL